MSALGHNTQTAAGDAEVALFQAPLAIGPYKGQAGGGNLKGHRLGLTGIQGNLLEGAEALDIGDEGGHKVGAVHQHGFLTGNTARIGYVHRHLEYIIGLKLGGRDLEVAVSKLGITEAEAEGPLHVHHSIIVIGAFHSLAVLGHLVVVGMEGVDVLGIGEGQLTGEVLVSGQEGGQGVGSIVGRQHHIYHSLGQRLNVSNEAGTAFVKDEDDGFAGGGQGLHQLLLVGREIEVVHIAGGLAVGVLTHAGHNDIGLVSGHNGLLDAGSVFLLPQHRGLVVHHAGLVAHLAREALLQGFLDGVVLRGKLIGCTLPAVAPATIEGAQAVGVGAGDQDALRTLEGQDAVYVLEENLRFHGGVIGLAGKGGRSKLGIFAVPGGVLKQTQTDLQTQDTAYGIVQALLGNLTGIDQVNDHVAALGIVGIHNHIDTGVDAHLHGLVLVGGHVVAGIQVVNIGPVGYKQTVPAQLFLDPAAQQDGVGMGGNAVDGGRIDHSGKGTGAEALQERSKEFLAEIVGGNDGRSTVLTGSRHAITHKVLNGNGHILKADMVGIVTLQGLGLLAGHFGLEEGIFTEAFPDTGPARVAAQVHHRGEHPRHLGGAGLVSHSLTHHTGIDAIEGSSQVDLLRIEGTVREIGGAVNHIQAIDAGYANGFHRLVLNLLDHGGGMLAAVTGIVHHIEDGAHLILTNNLVQLGRINGFVGIIFQNGDVELNQLASLLLEGHTFQNLFHLGLNGLVGRNHYFAFFTITGYNRN